MSQSTIIIFVVLAALPVVLLLALWSSFHRVSDGDVEILLVFGDASEILKPGLYFVPPFVSATYPVDFRTMQYETPQGNQSIPPAVRDDAERIAQDRANAREMRA